MLHLISLLTISLLIISCGKNSSPDSLSLVPGQVIVGQIDWLDIYDHRVPIEAFKNAKAVAHLEIPVMDSRCTGSLISKNVILTNQHCIPDSSYAVGVVATFNFDSKNTKTRKTYNCSKFLGNDEVLDYALLECTNDPGVELGFLELDPKMPVVGDEIYVLHQNCDYYSVSSCDPTKKYSLGTLSALSPELVYDADTLGGSSGSPVFSNAHKLVGLHHAGKPTGFNGRGLENYAVPMDKVFASIKKRFPAVFATGSTDPGQNIASYLREPNDSLTSATLLDLVALKTYSGLSIASNTDVDYFKVKNSSYKRFKVSLSFKHAEGDLDLKVYSAKGSLLKSSTGSRDSETVSFYTSGDFIVQVYGYKGAKASYGLAFE
jgi:V8-like Glu-specific endopeptidase